MIMPSIEDILSSVLKVLKDMLRVEQKPELIICGYKDNISTAGDRLVTKPTPIHEVVLVKCRSLGTGTYIALGDEKEQAYRLNAVDQELPVDFVDDLSKVVVSTDAGTTGAVEWIGG